MHQGEKQERKKKKKNEAKTKETPQQHQEEKKDDKKAHVVTIREKFVVKKTKVHRALKIHTSGDSNEVPVSKENPAPEMEILVEKDQLTSAGGNEVSEPKEDPFPEKEPVVEEDQNADVGGKQNDVHKDNTTLMADSPNAEKKNVSLTNSDDKDKEVNFIFFPQLYLFFEPLIVLTDFSFCICKMIRKKRLPKHRKNQVQRRYHSHLQTKTKLMKTRALKIMDPTKLMVTGSNQKRLMRSQMKRKEMSLRLTLIVAMLRIYQ
jgi:hypothetical protein